MYQIFDCRLVIAEFGTEKFTTKILGVGMLRLGLKPSLSMTSGIISDTWGSSGCFGRR